MERMLCSNLSYEELVRHLSPAERRAYWHGRQIGYFRLRRLGYKDVRFMWVSSKRMVPHSDAAGQAARES